MMNETKPSRAGNRVFVQLDREHDKWVVEFPDTGETFRVDDIQDARDLAYAHGFDGILI